MAIGTSPDGYIDPGFEWDIQLLQSNDNTVSFQMSNGPIPLVLAGWTLTMYLKANAAASDQSAFTNNPVITAPLLGNFTVNFPASQLTVATSPAAPLFYHVDGFENSTFPFTTTLVFGTVSILPI